MFNKLCSTRKSGLFAMQRLHMRRKFSEALEMYDKAAAAAEVIICPKVLGVR